MIYYGNATYYNSDFCHYGVKGMKWGVRKDREIGARQLTTNRAKEFLKDAGKATVQQAVSYIPGVGLVVSAATMTREIASKHIDYTKSEGKHEKVSDMKRTKPENPEESINKINISKGLRMGTFNNCASCAMAMDMRSKGYDVRARRQGTGLSISKIAAAYDSATSKKVQVSTKAKPQEVYDKTCDTIAKDNNGNSSGIITFTWRYGNCGHAIYYKSTNGEVEFYDGQNAKSGSKLDKYFVNCKPTGVEYIRTDNHEPSSDIGTYVVSREDNKNEKSDN